MSWEEIHNRKNPASLVMGYQTQPHLANLVITIIPSHELNLTGKVKTSSKHFVLPTSLPTLNSSLHTLTGGIRSASIKTQTVRASYVLWHVTLTTTRILDLSSLDVELQPPLPGMSSDLNLCIYARTRSGRLATARIQMKIT